MEHSVGGVVVKVVGATSSKGTLVRIAASMGLNVHRVPRKGRHHTHGDISVKS